MMESNFDIMGPGPDVKGTWYNKTNGTTISVRDMYITDDGMQVMTSDGSMIDGDIFSRDYIQCDDTIYDDKGNSTGKEEPLDYDALFAPNEAYNTRQSVQDTPEKRKASFEIDALTRFFNKLETEPIVEATIKWDKFPKAELIMLKGYFDVSDDDIVNYVYNTYCSKEDICKAISKTLQKLLMKS